MIVAGVLIIVAGVCGAIARAALGLPQAFPILLACSLILWLSGVGAAAAAAAPVRRVAGWSAFIAALLGWALLLLADLAPVWGIAAAGLGVTVIRHRDGRSPRDVGVATRIIG